MTAFPTREADILKFAHAMSVGLLGLANIEPDRPGAQPITDDMLWEKGYLPGMGPDNGD